MESNINTTWPPQAVDRGLISDPVLSTVGFWVGIVVNSVGVFGNFLVLAAIGISKQLRQTAYLYVFIASLAVNDLCAIAFVNVLQLAALRAREWPFSSTACIFQNFALLHFNGSSLLHTGIIAVYRCLAAVSTRYFEIAKKKTFTTCMLVATRIALVSQLPRLFDSDKFALDDHFAVCRYRKGSLTLLLGSLATVLFTITVVLVSYLKIRATLKYPAQSIDSVSYSNRKRHQAVVICMALISAVLTVGYLPFLISSIFENVGRDVPRELALIGMCLMWTANSTNWCIYGLLSRDFRSAYKQLLGHCWRSNRVETVEIVPVNLHM